MRIGLAAVIGCAVLSWPLLAQGGFDGPGVYEIASIKSGKVLDLDRNDQTTVIQFSSRGTDNQIWEIRPAGAGYFSLRNGMNGYALDAGGGGNSEPVRGVPFNGGPSQQWRFDSGKDGNALIVSRYGKVLDIPGGLRLMSYGWSNETPWKTPREVPEEELYRRLDGLAEQVDDARRAVFMIHVPPHDSGLDTAPILDENLRPTVSAGDVLRGPVGSTAVRRLIEERQPVLSVHGHVHESGGERKIGRTVCVNPGSEANHGILRGYLSQPLAMPTDKARAAGRKWEGEIQERERRRESGEEEPDR